MELCVGYYLIKYLIRRLLKAERITLRKIKETVLRNDYSHFLSFVVITDRLPSKWIRQYPKREKRDCNIDRIKSRQKQANAFTALQSNTVKKYLIAGCSSYS